MHKLLKLTGLIIVLTLSVESFAQKVQVSGKVIDAAGIPLIAVTVYEEGNPQAGTVTDFDGNYTLSATSPKTTLIFSCLGFAEVKEVIGSRTQINITLREEQLSIDAAEVVSVGYGSVTRRDLTGSISKVDMDELVKAPVVNFDQALTGKVAGVVVTTSDGAVGSEANITIRGNNSLTQSSAPLYIVDGFPTESSVATTISSADIESIDILKDASATAIYGARGANGVIVITTKKGQEGKPKISFSASFTGSKIANKVDLMNAHDFVSLQTEIYDMTGNSNIYLPKGVEIDSYLPKNLTENKVEQYDWQDAIYRTSLTQNYSISLSGGSKESGSRYNVSLSAINQDGIIVNSNFQRYQGKINFQQKIGKKITIDLLANYSRAITNGVTPTTAQNASSASGWLLYSVWGYRPVTPIGQKSSMNDDNVDEAFASADDYRFNPSKTVRNEHRKTIVDYMNANIGITWEIIDDLKLKITGGYTFNKRRREEFNGSQTYTGYEGSPSGKGINGSIYWNDQRTWLNENTLTYTKRIARKHNFQFLGGFTLQGETYDYKGLVSEQMNTEALGLNGMHTGNYQTVVPWQYDWTMMSGLFR